MALRHIVTFWYMEWNSYPYPLPDLLFWSDPHLPLWLSHAIHPLDLHATHIAASMHVVHTLALLSWMRIRPRQAHRNYWRHKWLFSLLIFRNYFTYGIISFKEILCKNSNISRKWWCSSDCHGSKKCRNCWVPVLLLRRKATSIMIRKALGVMVPVCFLYLRSPASLNLDHCPFGHVEGVSCLGELLTVSV